MKAIKIDVEKKSIYLVELEAEPKQLESIYKHLECDCFTVGAHYGDTNDYVYVDDNGLLQDYDKIKGCFTIQGQPQPLVGHGLIVGSDEKGEACDVKMTVGEAFGVVEFIPKEHIKVFIKSFR